MDGQLVQVCRPSNSSSELTPWYEPCAKDSRSYATKSSVSNARTSNSASRSDIGRSRHRDALQRITELEQKVEQLEGEKRQLQADLFGRRTETTTRSDRSNDLDDPQDDSQKPQRKRGQQPENPGPKRRDYPHLPVREKILELPPEQCVCPRCGQPFVSLGDTEDSEQIEIEVSAYRRVIRRRRYRRTCTCDGPKILTTPPAPKLIPKGRYGISVWVEVLLDKYFSYRPTERLLGSWRLLDLDLAPGTVTDGLQRLEVLLRPIYEALKERNPHGDLHQADETRWPVFVLLEGKEGYGWWLWVFLGPDTVVFCWMPVAVTRSPKTTIGPSRAGCWWSTGIRPTRR